MKMKTFRLAVFLSMKLNDFISYTSTLPNIIWIKGRVTYLTIIDYT